MIELGIKPERYKNLYDSILEGIVMVELDGRILECNRAYREMLGYSEEELRAMTYVELTPERWHDREAEIVDGQTKQRGYSDVYEKEYVRKDGTVFPVSLRTWLITDESGEPEAMWAIVRDITERKRDEEAARALEEKYRELTESLPGVVFELDATGRVTYTNRIAFEMFGYSEEDMERGVNALDLFEPVDRSRVEGSIEKIMDGRSTGAVREYLARRKDGTTFPCTVYSTLIEDSEWRPAGVRGILLDITDRVEAEDAVRRSEARYRQLFENAIEGIFQSAPDGSWLRVNPSFARMYGYDSPEQMEREVRDIADQLYADPDDRKEVARLLAELGFIKGIELRFKRRDGTTLWVAMNAQAVRDEAGNVVQYEGSTQDISDRKRIEIALQASEQKYRELAESLPQVVFEVGENGKFSYVNKSGAELFGYTKEEIEGKMTTRDVVSPQEHEKLALRIERLLAEGANEPVEYNMVKKDGTIIPGIVYSRTIIRDGRPVGIRGLATDISDRKTAEDVLKRVNLELEGFAHTVSHDIKNSLSNLSLTGKTIEELLSRELDDDGIEQLRALSEIVVRAADKAQRLTDSLLELAEAGQKPELVEPVDVDSVVRTVLDDYAGALEEDGVDVEVAGELGQVRANPTHVSQVFLNLVGNAVKHNDSTSPKIVIKRLESAGDGASHRYVICDNGSGIPEEDLERIFLPFFKGAKGDTGIGLSTVHKIVTMYGGDIRAYNDDGACFEFSLPDWRE